MLRFSRRVVLTSLLCLSALLSTARVAQGASQVFLSNSLSGSKATYVIQFDATVKGNLDRFQIAFPPGMLAAGAPGIGTLLIGVTASKTPIILSTDPLNPDTLVINPALSSHQKI